MILIKLLIMAAMVFAGFFYFQLSKKSKNNPLMASHLDKYLKAILIGEGVAFLLLLIL